jgi:hypothetical protein
LPLPGGGGGSLGGSSLAFFTGFFAFFGFVFLLIKIVDYSLDVVYLRLLSIVPS